LTSAIPTIRRQVFDEFLSLALREARADADVLQYARIVNEAEQR
jgi:hypothetical protein